MKRIRVRRLEGTAIVAASCMCGRLHVSRAVQPGHVAWALHETPTGRVSIFGLQEWALEELLWCDQCRCRPPKEEAR